MDRAEHRFFDKTLVASVLTSAAVGIATGWIFYLMDKNKSLQGVVPPQYRSGSGTSSTTNTQQPGVVNVYVYGGTVNIP